MEKKRIVQYLMVVLLGFSIFFMIFIATMFRILMLGQGDVPPQVYEEEYFDEEEVPYIESDYGESVCECR